MLPAKNTGVNWLQFARCYMVAVTVATVVVITVVTVTLVVLSKIVRLHS
jgi:hypothetical protein